MKYLLPLLLLLFSCEKETEQCFCRRQVWKKLGSNSVQFLRYDPYYREDCYKGGKWYDMDSTKKYFLICDL